MTLYRIVRFYRSGRRKRVIRTGQTLEQVQEWCNDPATSGRCWFDGYEKE